MYFLLIGYSLSAAGAEVQIPQLGNTFGRDPALDEKIIRAAVAQEGTVREKKSGEGIRTILCAFEEEGPAVEAEEEISRALEEEGLTPTREFHTKLRER